ncbi:MULTISPECIES: tRNA (cytosine(32)/uridine(32)-2'-O)-methyltransferase TrmJ [Shewanella]|jgi:tRNA (cytidine32/uridine32-2'-O)-methyltransferase|uniref:tRNA (cytosine(32)/uridine(32)-2'-O)-methyltransferase TrmJ n=1 Tax=Shewanella TaxID=22 RepID=UPI000C796066|nr:MULTISPECIES: tRNA (cytosine(32)/uridine(32)-2'-O)-methyltransferase TrmJ [Shewanella]MCL1059078.1 tRNA (cytosine(32)/uridine(32)-2'-O)-methyltransferase TrmJ [Shewanella gelidimarina]PKG59264.1 tRNA (cytosine(32)/uridine(32)-2'-O)-methyltransferase TrmJ [Shewanella sp. GutDb-MelDb]PKG73398.1 tRNA (cytosine(32)/uridine(32)-2'-O)-methyltransferase TrmJ [Shewanella sp. GutCb]
MLSNIRVVLVGTSHPGNIGSTARAMKTMGLSTLYLAEPRVTPDGHSVALAAGASDILKHAITVGSVEEAIADCSLVIATSARSRTLDWPMLEPREAGEKLVASALTGPVAIVFGRENNGLSNEELQGCDYHVAIPANPEYTSLNLAQAVQIICYEARVAHLAQVQKEFESNKPDGFVEPENEYPFSKERENFYEHMENTLLSTHFIVKQHPGQVMTKLRRLFSRARIERQEMNILRGILTSVDKVVAKNETNDK